MTIAWSMMAAAMLAIAGVYLVVWLQQRLSQNNATLPIVFLTGHGDFLTKPVSATDLVRAVRAAIELAEEQQVQDAEMIEFQKRLARPTPR
jgi:FixJ family two-component response regulator